MQRMKQIIVPPEKTKQVEREKPAIFGSWKEQSRLNDYKKVWDVKTLKNV